MEQSLSSNSLSGLSSTGNGGRNQLSNQQQGATGTNSAAGVNINNAPNENTELHDSSLEEIRGLSCQICYQNFSRDGEHVPRNLQCGHSYCTSCLNRLVGQYCIGTVRCPTCKHETLINGFMDDVHQLPKNFGVLEILAAQEEDPQRQGRRNPAMPKRPPPKPPNPPSNGGGASTAATGLSVGSTRMMHSGSNSLGSSGGSIGIAAPPSNYDISPYEMRCQVHEGEPMKVFCKTCNELICIYCQVYGSHQQHTCELVSQTAEQGRREVISMSENLGRSKENLLLARQIIIETISAVRHKEEKTIREVTHHFDTMRKRVHKRECQLKDMVKCKTSQKIAALEAQERTISDLIDRCEVTQRVCTRSLTEDDVTVVQEKDALLHEMTALSDISTECELAPVCIDNILCLLPRDAFDVIMIHGTVEESATTSEQDPLVNLADIASSSRQADVGFGDRVWAEPVEDSLTFLPNPPRDDVELGSNGFRQTRRGVSQRARGRLANPIGPHDLFPIGGGSLMQQLASDVPIINPARMNHARHRSLSHHSGRQRADLNASYSSTEEQLRSSIEEAIRAVQNAEIRESRGTRGGMMTPQCPREAAAQAAIKRQQVTQNLVGNILSVVRPALEEQSSEEGQTVDDTQLTSNLTTIESAMHEIQSAVSSARATLEESMGHNPINNSPGNGDDSNGSSTASSTTQQASPDSGSFEVARPSVQSGDEEEADDGRIYEQVSDGEVDNEQPPSSQVSIGQIVPEMLPQHPISDMVPMASNGQIPGDVSPLYHVYDSSNSAIYHTVNPSPVSQQARINYNSDSSNDRLPLTINGEDIYDGPYYSCDCGEDSVSCSCSECNSADEDEDNDSNVMINGRGQGATAGRSSGCRQRQFFSGIPNHLDLSSSLENQAALQMMHPAIMRRYRFQNDPHGDPVPAQISGGSRDQNNEDMGTMSKLLNRMNLIKNKSKNSGARKKHHHKSSTPTHRPRNARARATNEHHTNVLTSSSGSCGPFFLSPNRNCSGQGTSSNAGVPHSSHASMPSGGTRPKTSSTTQKQKSVKKTKTTPRSNEPRNQRQQDVVGRGISAESLATNGLNRGVALNSESHHNLSHSSLANSLPKCVNQSNGSCLSGERALFACSFCQKKYCHICAVHAAGKKCSKKPNKTHSIVALDEDLNDGNSNPNANLNVPKNPDSVSHTFMLKCTNCGDVSEFKVNSKACSKCRADLQVDLNLYNPCPNCDLLNSKDAIACELCSSDIIPIN